MSVNWIAAYNRLFEIINRAGEPTYVGGPDFLRAAQQVDKGISSYTQHIEMRKQKGKSTSRRDFYWDVIQSFTEDQKIQFFRIFIDLLEPHAKDDVDALRSVIFGGNQAVPTTIVPQNLWSSEKLNLSLKEIDRAIDQQQFNRAINLAYTCLEGLYKSYIREHLPNKSEVTDLIPLSKLVKDDLSSKLKIDGVFPEQIINIIPTITNAVASSRNSFSEAHFDKDANKWLAHFSRDLTNSIGHLLLHFVSRQPTL